MAGSASGAFKVQQDGNGALINFTGGGGGIAVAGTSKIYLGLAGVTQFVGSLGLGAYSAADVFLARDAANAFAQRNSTNAQVFRVYNTFTDASNGEWLSQSWSVSANVMSIQTMANGSGTVRNLLIGRTGGNAMTFSSANINIDASGPLIWNNDNTQDIGASGATRPRNLFLGGGVTIGATTLLTSSVALANGAAAQVGTLTNAPAAGNPTKWVPINDNGTTRYIPCW